ncbi:MAG: hypothetical protein RIT81_43980 [Deltaproteobacteria bacterium]
MSDSNADAPGVPDAAEDLTPRLRALLANGAHDEALDLLYRVRERDPKNINVTRAIQTLKERMTLGFFRTIGSLDHVPRAAASTLPDITHEERLVLQGVDGIATFEDLIESCSLGRFRTSRVLARLMERGGLVAQEPSSYTPVPRSVSDTRFRLIVTEPTLTPASVVEEPTPHPIPIPVPDPVVEPAAAPAPGPVADEYTTKFADATKAYLERRYEDAINLFEACLTLRPGDRRAQHNLERIRSRSQ